MTEKKHNMPTYLVTGAAGFIGSHLVEILLDQNVAVIGMDNFSNGFRQNLSFIETHPNRKQFQLIEGDICDKKTCESLCQKADYVLHHAALGSVAESIAQPERYHINNVTGTLNMLLASKKHHIKRFVFASSAAIYGDRTKLPTNETALPSPKSPYAINKISAEYYCNLFYQEYQMPTVIFRYFNVYGPRQNPKSDYAAAIPKIINRCLNQTAPIIYGNGLQTRDFIYVQDIANANRCVCQDTFKYFGAPINLAGGAQISIKALVKQIQKLTKNTHPIQYDPPRPGDIKKSVACIDLSKKHIRPLALTPLASGLTETISFYKKNK